MPSVTPSAPLADLASRSVVAFWGATLMTGRKGSGSSGKLPGSSGVGSSEGLSGVSGVGLGSSVGASGVLGEQQHKPDMPRESASAIANIRLSCRSMAVYILSADGL